MNECVFFSLYVFVSFMPSECPCTIPKPCCHVFNFFSNIFLLKSSCVCCSFFRFVRCQARLMRKIFQVEEAQTITTIERGRVKERERVCVYFTMKFMENYGWEREWEIERGQKIVQLWKCVCERTRENHLRWFNQPFKMSFQCHCRRWNIRFPLFIRFGWRCNVDLDCVVYFI